MKQNLTKKFKKEQSVLKDSKQEQGANLQPVIIELLNLTHRKVISKQPNKRKVNHIRCSLDQSQIGTVTHHR